MAEFIGEIFRSQGKGFPKSRQLNISKKELLKIVDNFNKGINGYGLGPDGRSRTKLLLTHDSDHPKDRVGYVTELAYVEETKSLWATAEIDEIKQNQIVSDIDKGQAPDVSIAFGREPDMKDMGRYLIHVALVNDPKIVDLTPLKRASNDGKIEMIYCSNLSPFKEVNKMEGKEKEVEEEVEEITESVNLVTKEANEETESEEELATKSVLQAFIDKYGKAKLYEVLKKAQKDFDEEEDEEDEEEKKSKKSEKKASNEVVKKSEGLIKKVKKMLGVDAESKDLKTSMKERDTEIDQLKASLGKANEVMELALKEKEDELEAQKDKEWEMVFDDYLEAKMTTPAEKEFLADKCSDVEELKTYLDGRGIEFDLHTESIVASKEGKKEKDDVLSEGNFAYLRGKGWIDENNKPVNERCKKVVEAYRENIKEEKENEN